MHLPDYSRLDQNLLAFLDKHYGKWNTQIGDLALSTPLQEERKISRQAATSLLNRLISNGILTAGKGLRPKTYELERTQVFRKTYKLSSLEEHVVWLEDMNPILRKYVGDAAIKIWEYSLTEMINNAIDHSEGKTVTVSLDISAVYAECMISDDGEGIFRRIKRLCDLPDERQAMLELSKGKLTTAPDAHSGEGIFFTSRAMDYFDLDSYGLSFNHVDGEHPDEHPDVLMESDLNFQGTQVVMSLNHRTTHSLKALFDEFATPGSFSFNRTIVPVRLAKIGAESLVSRSQARRLLARIEKFEHVMFDFSGIESIGQAFADEIFRVFRNEHPEVTLKPINTNDEITFMIKRAQSHG